MREIATRKKPVFVQANSNSGQGHVLHYITSFCVVFRLSTLYFWLAGKTETKQVVNRMSKWVEGGGSWKGHESGQAVFIFLAASPLVLARFAREFRGFAACAPGLTKPPCYAGYSYRHHWFHFRGETSDGVAKCRLFFQTILVQTSAENYAIKWTLTALKITNDSRETFVLSYKFFVFVRYISLLETVPSLFADAP